MMLEVPVWVPAHFHFLDLRRQEKLGGGGGGGGGNGEPRQEQINCVISASVLDPRERRQLEERRGAGVAVKSDGWRFLR